MGHVWQVWYTPWGMASRSTTMIYICYQIMTGVLWFSFNKFSTWLRYSFEDWLDITRVISEYVLSVVRGKSLTIGMYHTCQIWSIHPSPSTLVIVWYIHICMTPVRQFHHLVEVQFWSLIKNQDNNWANMLCGWKWNHDPWPWHTPHMSDIVCALPNTPGIV